MSPVDHPEPALLPRATRASRATRALLIAALAVALGACFPGNRIQWGGGDNRPGLKTVQAKEEPITLVAVDGTRCQVSTAKFQETKIGDRVWCGWRDFGGEPRPGKPGGIGTPGGVATPGGIGGALPDAEA